jgi:hypothetical protein
MHYISITCNFQMQDLWFLKTLHKKALKHSQKKAFSSAYNSSIYKISHYISMHYVQCDVILKYATLVSIEKLDLISEFAKIKGPKLRIWK